MLDFIIINKRWLDDKWLRELPDDSHRLLFFTLLSQPQNGYCGIYELNLDRLTLTVRSNPFVPAMLDQFERDGKIVRDRSWVWIVNFTENQDYNAKAFRSAITEYRRLKRRTPLAERWLERYATLNEHGKFVQVGGNSDEMSEIPATRPNGPNGRTTEHNKTEQNSSAAVAAAPHLQLAEKIEAIARRLASEHGYALDLRRPEQLADGLVKSGLPLAELEETITWAADDPFYRGELCLQSKLLNGGMFRRMHNDRLTSLAKQQARGGTVYGQPPADVVYPSLEDALAQQKCPPPLPGEQAVLQ